MGWGVFMLTDGSRYGAAGGRAMRRADVEGMVFRCV